MLSRRVVECGTCIFTRSPTSSGGRLPCRTFFRKRFPAVMRLKIRWLFASSWAAFGVMPVVLCTV